MDIALKISQINSGNLSFSNEWLNGNWSNLYKYAETFALFIIGIATLSLFILLFKLLRKTKELPYENYFRVVQLFLFIGCITSIIIGLSFWYSLQETKLLLLSTSAIILCICVWGFIKVLPQLNDLLTPSQSEINVMKRTAELAEMNNTLLSMNLDLDRYNQAATRDILASTKLIGEQIQLIKDELRTFSVTEKRKLRRIENEKNNIETTCSTIYFDSDGKKYYAPKIKIR